MRSYPIVSSLYFENDILQIMIIVLTVSKMQTAILIAKGVIVINHLIVESMQNCDV